MKNKIILFCGILFCLNMYSQAPQKMSYQSVIRDASNALVSNTTVGIRISILQGSVSGTSQYVEVQTVNTNTNGLATLAIGNGTVELGSMSSINWSNGPFFIKTETDPTGGTNYSITGTSELMSVPYALFSANGTPGPAGAAGPQGPTGPIGPAGATGADGTNGTNGSSAYQIAVANGFVGTEATWLSSLQGIQGLTGAQGSAGATGATGGYPVHYIGESYGGGIVFYVYDGGQHGLIASDADQSAAILWYNGIVRHTGTTGDGLGAGAMNTAIIVAAQIADNETGNFAAKLCADYSVTVGGVTYGDWYLPSKHELNLLYLQKTVVGGFASDIYWSSTEYDNIDAWFQYFSDGAQYPANKSMYNSYVRAVRAF